MKRIVLALMIIALVVAVGCAKQAAEPAAKQQDSVVEMATDTVALEDLEQDLDPENVEGLDDIGSLFEDY